MALQPGDTLHNRYLIEDVIAKGGMGAIYRATDLVLNIAVAVKENFRKGEDFIRQFRREATLLAGLNHPNLPRVTDHFVSEDGGQYLVMDFIEGEDLRERLGRQGGLPESDVVHIGAVVCEALQYLHTRIPPVVHRDIKPGNIKVTSTGQVFLVDFGLAKLSHSGQVTTTGAQALTPGYAPPEQYGEGTEPRSDIYALGATLYAVLTNKIPEDGLERAMESSTLTPLRSVKPGISVETARAIEKAMEIRPENRFASASEFRKALLGGKDDAPLAPELAVPPPQPEVKAKTAPASISEPTQFRLASAAIPPSVAPAPAHPSRRFPLWAGIGIGGVMLAGALLAWALLPKFTPTAAAPTSSPAAPVATVPPTAIPQAAETPTQPPSPSPSLTPTLAPSSTQPAPSPTATIAQTPLGGGGGQLAFSSNRSGQTQIWLVDAGGQNFKQVTQLPEGACQPAWSPDGKRLVFISPCTGKKDNYPGASLFIIQADGTGLVPLASLPGGDFDPAWSPDGDQIAFTSLRSGKLNIYLYTLADNSVKRISSPVNVERRPAWSPDGSQIAYETRRNGQAQIWVMSATGTNMHEFSPLTSGLSTMPAWSPLNPAAGGPLLVYSQGGSLPYLVTKDAQNASAPEIRLSDTLTGVQEANFSHDGWWIGFTQVDLKGASQVMIMTRSGTKLSVIPGGSGGDFHPAWRP